MALILSFIFPGLGQIYKREILKGISFIMTCTFLIVPLFFFSPLPSLLYISGFSILLLMWLVGMVDAYVDDEFLMGREQGLIWHELLSILPAAVISAAVIVLAMLWMQSFSAANRRLVASARLKMAPDDHSLPHNSNNTGTNSNGTGIRIQFNEPEFFSVQVGSFGESKGAEEVYRDLLYKGYTATIEQATSGGRAWHRVLVGKFANEQEAVSFAKKLQEREKFSDMVIRRRSTEKESENLP